ncbi:uncharacterized protein LOC116293433 [Actinia tenebrosa]|uniref:Uncharacterized protein LOC116293433 n=1 Tax=Actinia tenebrosa TaxID=6105 RepID=A0A6P8HK04_ACTTE|nr:uncharacterized protein LOC116293433 [Actinia tenebrosa]
MKGFLGVVVLISSAVLVSSLQCWMCPGGQSSFQLCDDNKIKQPCKVSSWTRCATFSYFKNGSRIFAKSCTSEALCSKNSTFCASVPGGEAKYCRVQCCETNLCNFQVGFATTTAPSTTAATTTRRTFKTTTSTSLSPRETTEEQTEKPLNPSKNPQSGEDDEDCSWVDGSASSVTNNVFTSRMCLVLLAIFLLVF